MAAQIPPATRYTFMSPWVAEYGQDEVIKDLHLIKDKPVLVLIEKEADVWGIPVKDYLKNLIQELDQEYIPVDNHVYISPGLKTRCDNAGNK
jgi:hypothetical protein